MSTEHNSTDKLTGKTVQYLLLDLGYTNLRFKLTFRHKARQKAHPVILQKQFVTFCSYCGSIKNEADIYIAFLGYHKVRDRVGVAELKRAVAGAALGVG